MRNSDSLRGVASSSFDGFDFRSVRIPRHFLLGLLLIFALLAFEAFNFDTTRYALDNLLGDVRFAGIAWATILAIAFCAIDFAGLGRLFTPERGFDEPRELWYLTGAWLLGATMNAVMTWWAVSTVLLSHELGNEVLSREQLLHIVPVFVAVLVWLTRILFIGAITMAGERLLHGDRSSSARSAKASMSSGSPTRARRASLAAESTSAHTLQSAAVDTSIGSSSVSAAKAGSASHAGRRPPRPGTGAYRATNRRTAQASGRPAR